MSFEKIVRPFQDQSTSPPQVSITSSPSAPGTVLMTVGRNVQGGNPTFETKLEITTKFYVDDKHSEKKEDKETTKKKIKNPDDPSQWVEIERYDKMSTKGINGQKHDFKFKYDD